MTSERRYITWTPEQRARYERMYLEAEEDRDEIIREALRHKRELDVRIEAYRELERERLRSGLTVEDVAARSGVDVERVVDLSRDPIPSPTLSELLFIADAIGTPLQLTLTRRDAA